MARSNTVARIARETERDEWYDAVYSRFDSAWRELVFLARTAKVQNVEDVTTEALGQFIADVLVAQGMTADDAVELLENALDAAQTPEEPSARRRSEEDHEHDD